MFDVATGPQKQFFKAYVVNFFKPCWTLPPPLPRVTGRHPGAPLIDPHYLCGWIELGQFNLSRSMMLDNDV